MKAEHLRAFIWLRWRIRRNQMAQRRSRQRHSGCDPCGFWRSRFVGPGDRAFLGRLLCSRQGQFQHHPFRLGWNDCRLPICMVDGALGRAAAFRIALAQ